ncbi:hypothetical protein GOD57_30150 [Sinorhizobium medicae]|nr:hypothetical protein [Sinorhizobium medicae]
MHAIYAIGDIHGRADLLRPLIKAIKEDTKGGIPRFIFLGDIVDRGPESKECMEIVDDTLLRFPGSRLVLGNHDERFWHAISGILRNNECAEWLASFGGWQTVESYCGGQRPSVQEFAALMHDYYDHHIELLRSAVDKVETGNFCFVHAGVRPGVSLADQDPLDLRWIRDEFLQHSGLFGKMIVHGHTPTESEFPEIHRNRIAVDTGAYYSGRLTAAVMETDGARRFICATEKSAGSIDIEHIAAEQAVPLLPTA